MSSLSHARWQRFGLNAARYALGPIGGLVVPWLVIHQSASPWAWGHALRIIIPLQLFIHVAAWGSRDHLLRLFATGSTAPRLLAAQSMFTRAVVFLPVLLLVGLLATDEWRMGALWAAGALFATSFEAVFIWQKRFGFLLLLESLGLLAQCVVLILFQPLDTSTVLISFVFNVVVKMVLLRIWSLQQRRTVVKKDPPVLSFRSHFSGALPFLFIGLSGLLATRIDLYTANALLGDDDLGKYQITASLFVQFQALAALIVGPLTRDLFKLKGASVLRYARWLRTWALVGCAPMCVIAWAVLHFGFGFELPWHAYVAACLMVWPVFANAPIIYTLFKQGHERPIVWASFAAAAVSCTLTLALLPRLGITGGLLAAAAGQWLMFARVQMLTHRLTHAAAH